MGHILAGGIQGTPKGRLPFLGVPCFKPKPWTSVPELSFGSWTGAHLPASIVLTFGKVSIGDPSTLQKQLN